MEMLQGRTMKRTDERMAIIHEVLHVIIIIIIISYSINLLFILIISTLYMIEYSNNQILCLGKAIS
jgi:hypothetical protein